MGREKCRGAEGRGFLFTATWPAPIGKLPGSQQNDPGSPASQADGSLVLQRHGHTSLSSQQKDLTCTGMAVTCQPAERTQPPFNEASLIAFLWGALYKESSCCFLLWGRDSWHGVAQEVAGITSRSGHPGVLGCFSSPLGVAVPCDQAALLAGPEAWECWRGLWRCLLQGTSPQVLVLKSSTPARSEVPHCRLHAAISPTPAPASLAQAAWGPVHHSPPLLELFLLFPSPAPCPTAPCALNETSHEQLQPAGVWGDADGKAGPQLTMEVSI